MSDDTYAQLEAQVAALYDDRCDFVANAGNFAALIRHELPSVNWAGFYLVTPDGDLVLGPFSGRPACTYIAKGTGICGAAAQQQRTLVVADVNAFDGHIACDIASSSEIVVPLLRDGLVWAVFDVDSPQLNRFSDRDRLGLESLLARFSSSALLDTQRENSEI
jgi:GAF domain-containing protein